MDPRWQNLPHTDTEFVPTAYADRETWEKKRAHLKKQVLFAAGLWPMPAKPPLNARIWNRIERDGYTIEKVWFQSLPGFYVGGSLFRPIDPQPQGHPGVISPHGHSALGRLNESDAASYQARGLSFARIGCTAFMWDMIDYNDSARHLSGAYEEETYGVVHREPWIHAEDERMLWNLNSLGFQLWNCIRALDFIEQLPEVDTTRLACTGESGGGTQAYNLYAVDDRLAAAAPVCMVSAYMQGGCSCENAPLLRLDTHNVDIGATIAPKPLLLVSSAQDWTQHTHVVEYPAIKEIYELYDAGEKVEEVQIDAPHGYNKPMREAVYRWLARCFDLPIAQDYGEEAYATEPHENLLAFFDGLPAGAIDNHNDLIQQSIAAAKEALVAFHPDTIEKLAENRRVLGEALRLAVGYDESSATLQGATKGACADLPYVDSVLVGDIRGVKIPLRTFMPATSCGVSTVLIDPLGKQRLDMGLVRELLARGHAVYAIDPFATGENVGEQEAATPRGSTNFFTTFNRTDDAERICDIALALRYLLATNAKKLHVVAFGPAGLWALVAGAILARQEASMHFVIDANAFATANDRAYLNSLPIPGMLRAGGLPNAAALIAPHGLLLHNTNDAFETSRAKAAFALHPRAMLVVEEARLDNAALLAHIG
ncbi:MAG: alpha/beta hydrolase family protein [Candidatus Latescibacterota bacterium]|jgi:dienelactone hydrolase